jgi:hypothetical protein
MAKVTTEAPVKQRLLVPKPTCLLKKPGRLNTSVIAMMSNASLLQKWFSAAHKSPTVEEASTGPFPVQIAVFQFPNRSFVKKLTEHVERLFTLFLN